ncbi:MAG: 4Fe-4S dicluster domain-containing protein, partial [Bradymonadaceae bacterium]
ECSPVVADPDRAGDRAERVIRLVDDQAGPPRPRGEPRGRRNREQRRKEAEGAELELGDCIDCGACVRTCPTGIDIRDGLQMECVNCTQCIDACNDIMRSIDKPEGLIRLISENELQGNETRLVRPRVVMYALLAAVLFGAFGFMLATRHPLEVDITRPSGEPFRTLPSGKVANRLEFRVRNATSEPATVRLKVTRPEGAGFRGGNGDRMELAGGEMKRLEGFVVVPSDSFDATGSAEATFTLTTDTGVERQMSYRLLGPSNRSSP